MRKKKILMLNYEFPPLGGGAGNATYYLLKEFSNHQNLEIDLVTTSINGAKTNKFSKNITIHFLDIGKKEDLHYQSNTDLLRYSWKAYQYCKKLIEKKKFDLCHAFFGIPCGYIAMKLNIPYIISLRGSDVPGHNPKYKFLDTLFFKRLSKKIWNNAKEVIVNSKDLKWEAKRIKFNKKIIIILNGIDTSFYRKMKIKKSNKFDILYVGRLSTVKGLKYLFKAFNKLNKRDTQLVLAGDGNQKRPLINLAKKLRISNRVKFLGILSKKQLVKEYNKADIFILPSIHEGMSNTLLEAMSCSLPIISTNTGGVRDILKGNGLITKSKDSQELYESIRKLHLNKNLREEMAKKSRKIAEKMKWRDVASKYLEVYEK